MSSAPDPQRVAEHRFPVHGWAGAALVLAFWALNWTVDGPRTHVFFFPLWLGYILAVDGLVHLRRGASILSRSRRGFVALFVASAPAWWLFEMINLHTQNWTYVGAELFSDLEYAILCTVAFSTVMPAVFETAELVRSFRWVDERRTGPRIPASRHTAAASFSAGVAAALLIYMYPDGFYPFIWGMLFGLIEAANLWTGQPSLFDALDRCDWRPALSLALGALICGFFWELWNMYSFPRWTYRTPGVEFLYFFEMPLLGYLGYPPFGLELYALAHLLLGKKLNVAL
ncbi:MAG: hypothetical protein WD021_08070 [Rhodothermales bacterium]